jgi:lipopolysaccharide transport system permease protein
MRVRMRPKIGLFLYVVASLLAAALAGATGARAPTLGLALGATGLASAIVLGARPGSTRPDAAAALLLSLVTVWLITSLAGTFDPAQAVTAEMRLRLWGSSAAFLGVGAAAFLSLRSAFGYRADDGSPASPTASEGRPVPGWLLALLVGALALTAATLPVSIAAMQIGLAACAATLFLALLLGARPPAASPLDAPMLCLSLAAAISIAFSASPAIAETTAIRAILAFFVLSRALRLVSDRLPRAIAPLLTLWICSGALAACLGFAQSFTGFDLVAWLGFRPPIEIPAPGYAGHLAAIGTFNSRLTFAHVTLFPLTCLSGLLVTGAIPPRLRPWALAVLALDILGLWASFARGAWVALLAAIVILGLSSIWAGRSRRGIGLAAMLLLGLVLALFLSPSARDRARSTLSVSSNADRLFIWGRGMEIAADHPVVGVGFGSYPHILGPYYDRRDPAFPMRTWAHDMPLSLLAECGPLGLFGYIWIFCAWIWMTFWRGRPKDPWSAGLSLGSLLGGLAFFTLSLFHDALYDGEVAYNLSFSLALGALAASMRERAPVRASDAMGSPVFEHLREIYGYRALVWALVTRELRARYRGSVLGFFWTFFNPLLLMAVYFIVFKVFMKQELAHYTYFMFVGLLPWILFSNSLNAGAQSLSQKRDLLTRVKFPPQVLPAVTVVSELVNYLMAMPLMLLLGLAEGVHVGWPVVFFPLILALQLCFTFSVVLLLSALNVFYRDLQHVVQNMLTFWFFLVPVIYPQERIPPVLRHLVVDLDPMAVIVTSYQAIFYWDRLPDFGALTLTLLVSLLLLTLAIRVFEGRRDEFAEVV